MEPGRRGYARGMDDDMATADEHDHPGEVYPLEDALHGMQEMPVGALDPNIVGDAGPTDVPPGTDPPTSDEPAGGA